MVNEACSLLPRYLQERLSAVLASIGDKPGTEPKSDVQLYFEMLDIFSVAYQLYKEGHLSFEQKCTFLKVYQDTWASIRSLRAIAL